MSSLRHPLLAALSLALVISGATASTSNAAPAPDVVRVPQVVVADALKMAVVGSADDLVGDPFTVVDAGGETVHNGTLQEVPGTSAPWAHAAAADFTAVDEPGTYRVVVG